MEHDKSSTAGLRQLSGRWFLAGCALLSLALILVGRGTALPRWVLAAEVFVTVVALFVFGSIRFRLNKNALTYGAALVIGATFWGIWWKTSALSAALETEGVRALWPFVRRHAFSLEGLDDLIHIDTMLFILGLTFFVAVIGQTRMLESLSFALLRRGKGTLVPAVALLAGVVALASGVLDGVSMIGLLIRTLVILMILARADRDTMIYTVMVSTVVTTVCGMWLAYGEPPNLIMKSNLHPHLNDAFFLRYCLPGAVGSFLIVMWNLRRRLGGLKIDAPGLDVLDLHTADVRFLQAARHGKVLNPVEFLEAHREELGPAADPVLKRVRAGAALGKALAAERVPEATRRGLMGKYVYEDLAEVLDEHYAQGLAEEAPEAGATKKRIRDTFKPAGAQRSRAQRIGMLSFLPFIGLLVWHAVDHHVPLFLSSFAAFGVALTGIARIAPMRRLAFREAVHEYSEYLFLFPLFLSISLLQKTGFFDQVAALIRTGTETLGASHVSFLQFAGTTVLSAVLDNNVVADFAGRAIHGLELGLLHLFAFAQIAGYAVGGCWTHIGSAQSVVAYSFIQREVDARYTPFQWIRAMTPVVLEIFILMTVLVYGEGLILRHVTGG